jgi:hypothetical protein
VFIAVVSAKISLELIFATRVGDGAGLIIDVGAGVISAGDPGNIALPSGAGERGPFTDFANYTD